MKKVRLLSKIPKVKIRKDKSKSQSHNHHVQNTTLLTNGRRQGRSPKKYIDIGATHGYEYYTQMKYKKT
jgi:hypothetical protein